MSEVQLIACKDCGKRFTYGGEAAARDRRAGLSPPERCPDHRAVHRREYAKLGCSHVEVVQVRTDGSGGLAYYDRPRPEPVDIEFEELDIGDREKRFPINEIVPDVLAGLLDTRHQVHVVVGPTGSGKSTWLPLQMLCCDDLTRRGPICVTQPRIPAVEGPASFIGQLYYGRPPEDGAVVGPGLAIGYRHSGVGRTQVDAANRLIFMTDGTLRNELLTGAVGRYSVVMIDEAHERSVNIDTILALLREQLPHYPQLQLLIASATVDAARFANFFGPKNVRVHEGKGFTYPILDVFADEAVAHCPSPPGRWTEVGVKEAEELRIEPAPVCRHASLGDRLRHYPQFETLVFQGVMDDDTLRGLQREGDDPIWHKALDTLAESSRRERSIGPGKSQPPEESIRGKLDEPAPGDPTPVKWAARERIIHAVVDQIERLCARDEVESAHRHARWERRGAGNVPWKEMREPGRRGHIIVFFPAARDIEVCVRLLKKRLKSLPGKNELHRFFRNATAAEKQAVTRDTETKDNPRRIVLATNLAETSLTLDGLVQVIDTGLICESYFDARKRETNLPTILHSVAGCRQRVGRVGRKEPGEAYRLYTREELTRHPAYTTPEIARSNAEPVLLLMAAAGLPPDYTLKEGALMEPPPAEELRRARGELESVGALDGEGDLTQRGDELRNLRVDRFHYGPLLIEADRFACLWEMAVFLAFLDLPDRKRGKMRKRLALWDPDSGGVYDDQAAGETPDGNADPQAPDRSGPGDESPWLNPFWSADVLTRQRQVYGKALDDLELYLQIWQCWASQSRDKRARWARDHGLSHSALEQVRRRVGIGPDAEGGLMSAFLPLEDKGELWRDICFEKLDKVRYLYAAAVPDSLFRLTGQRVEPWADRAGTWKPHEETVWSPAAAGVPHRNGHKAALRYFAAVEGYSWSNRDIPLRHIVWLDPTWFDGAGPTLEQSPSQLAHHLSGALERALLQYARRVFATGADLAGLPEVTSDIQVRTDPQILEQARVHKKLIKTRHEARVIHHVAASGDRQPNVIVELADGKRFGLERPSKKTVIQPRQRLQVEITQDKDSGFLWARFVKGAPKPPTPTPPPPKPRVPLHKLAPNGTKVTGIVEAVARQGRDRGFHVTVRLEDGSKHSWHVFRSLTEATIRKEAVKGRKGIFRVAWDDRAKKRKRPDLRIDRWLDGGRIMDIRDDYPVGTEFTARAVRPAKLGYYDGYLAAVALPSGATRNWKVRLDRNHRYQGDETPCRVRITEWVDGPHSVFPHLRHVDWLRG